MAALRSQLGDAAAFSIMPSNPKKKLCPANKVIVLGSGGVGKTALVHRLAAKCEPSAVECAPLMGDYLERVALVDDQKQLLKLQLWDTAGQGSFGSAAALPRAYFRHARAAVLVYDATNRRSFEALLTSWLAPLQELYAGCAFSLTLVATKTERAEARQVSPAQGRWLAAALGADHFFECSASSAGAADECFRAIARAVAAGSTWSVSATAVEAALEQLRAAVVSSPSELAAAPRPAPVATSAAVVTVASAVAEAVVTATVALSSASATAVLTTPTLLTSELESGSDSETELESEPESESEAGFASPRKLRSPSVQAIARDALASTECASSAPATGAWTQLLQVHSAERKLLVGSAALLLAMPVLLLFLLLLLELGCGDCGIGDSNSNSAIGARAGTAMAWSALAAQWLERLGAACSSLVDPSGAA